jgi:hypothetical protein
MTTQDTAEYLEILKKITSLSPPDTLRLAAELLEQRKPVLAEAIARKIVDELAALRIAGARVRRDCKVSR